MKKRITRISIKQSSKVLAVLYSLGFAVVFIPVALFQMITNSVGTGLLFLALPLLYAALIYVVTAVVFFFYNLVAKKLGGIEVELSDVGV